MFRGFKFSLVYSKKTINFLEKEDVDYCVELLLFVLALSKRTLSPTAETGMVPIKSLNFEDGFQSVCMNACSREIIYLSLHCHHQDDFCIKVGSDENHFNVSLIVMDKVTRQYPQTTTF